MLLDFSVLYSSLDAVGKNPASEGAAVVSSVALVRAASAALRAAKADNSTVTLWKEGVRIVGSSNPELGVEVR